MSSNKMPDKTKFEIIIKMGGGQIYYNKKTLGALNKEIIEHIGKEVSEFLKEWCHIND